MASEVLHRLFTFENHTTGETLRVWLRKGLTVADFLNRAQALAYVPVHCPIHNILLCHRARFLELEESFDSINLSVSESILIVCHMDDPSPEMVERLCQKGFPKNTVLQALRQTNCNESEAESLLSDPERVEQMLGTIRDTLQAYPEHVDMIICDLKHQGVIHGTAKEWLEDMLLDPSQFALNESLACELQDMEEQSTPRVDDDAESIVEETTLCHIMDPETARLQAAADQGDALSQYNFGVCLHSGSGVEQNLTEAARYFKMAADQGLVEGIYNYGVCLYDSNGVSETGENAPHYFKLAADMGYTPAQVAYSRCLVKGEGVPLNLAEAAHYLKAAADSGNHEAQRHYGTYLLYGKGVPMNPGEAVRYLKMASDGGQTVAMYNYATCLYSGHGIEKDLGTAVRYFKMAADGGCANAQYNLGVMLCNGKGVQKNVSEGARYLKMCADQGMAEGQALYGQCLFHGDGVQRDVAKAAQYFKLSADQGIAEARQYYEVCLHLLSSIPPDPLEVPM